MSVSSRLAQQRSYLAEKLLQHNIVRFVQTGTYPFIRNDATDSHPLQVNIDPNLFTEELLAKIGEYVDLLVVINRPRFQAVVSTSSVNTLFATAFAKDRALTDLKMSFSLAVTEVEELRSVSDTVQTVLMLDGLLTDGASQITAVRALHKAGFCVTHLITLIDYGHQGRPNLQELGVTTYSIFTLRDLLEQYAIDSVHSSPAQESISGN